MVDMIPGEYRSGLRLRRLLAGFGWTCLALVLALGVSFAALAHAVSKERTALARSRQLQAQNAAWQARLAELKTQKENTDSRLRSLDALRGGGAPIGAMFNEVDAALNGRVWFRELAFSRGGEPSADKAEAGGPGKVPAAAADKSVAADANQRGARAEILGIAADHAALADFIRAFGTRPGVAEVKLRDTSTRSYSNVQVVDFHLAATMDVAAGAAQ